MIIPPLRSPIKTIRWILAAVVIIVLIDCLLLNPLFLKRSAYQHDDVIGWVPKKNFQREFTQKDAAGNRYNASFSLDQHGFRAYGNITSSRTKIVFVGDSFTGDPYVGNEEAYFSVVKRHLREKFNLDVEIFAAGAGGYSTLQEYLLIKEQIRIIKPDLFILQFCENDFMNNHPEWEQGSAVKNQAMLRAYYNDDTNSFGRRDSLFARLYRFSYTTSFLFRRVDGLLQMFFYKYHHGYSKPRPLESTHKFLTESYAITEEVLELFTKELPGNTRRFIVNASTMDRPYTDIWEKLCHKTGFTPLVTPPLELERQEKAGEVVRHADGGHMNNRGNRVFGEALAEEMYGQMQLPDMRSSRGEQRR